MRIGSGTWRGLAVAIAGFTVVACGPTPPSPVTAPDAQVPAGQPVSATSQQDGVIVTLALSSDRVIAGDRIRIRISALNAGLGPVAYEAGGCGPIMGIDVGGGPPLPARAVDGPPQGTDGAAVLALARWSALSQGGPQLDWIRTEGMPDDAAMACTADLRYEDIAPGQTFTDEAVWIARIGDGAPAPAGEYRVELGFPFAGRRSKDDVPFEGRVVTPIRVAVPLAVAPGPPVAVDAAAAIDAAIADPEVSAWAARSLTRERLEGATITMIDGRWRWQIRYAGGRTDVFVDPVTGKVVERRIGP